MDYPQPCHGWNYPSPFLVLQALLGRGVVHKVLHEIMMQKCMPWTVLSLSLRFLRPEIGEIAVMAKELGTIRLLPATCCVDDNGNLL